MFARLDDVLIEQLFQPIADTFLNRAGIGRETVTCACVDIASLSWIVSRVPSFSHAAEACNVSSAFLELSFLLLGLVALISLRMLFRRAKGKQENPLRMPMQPHRAIVLMMLGAHLLQLQAPGVADVADIAMLAFATCALYLGACAQRPPFQPRWKAILWVH